MLNDDCLAGTFQGRSKGNSLGKWYEIFGRSGFSSNYNGCTTGCFSGCLNGESYGYSEFNMKKYDGKCSLAPSEGSVVSTAIGYFFNT